jgi:hypothetical protein
MNEHLNDPGMEYVERALSALREASVGNGAPDHLQIGLREAFRERHQPTALVRRTCRYAWVAGAIAASLAIVAAVRLSQPPVVDAPDPAVFAKTPVANPLVAEIRNEPKPAPRRPKRTPQARREALAASASAPAGRELTTDFFAIPYAPAMTHVDRGQLIRLNVPATSMRSFGLPVSEERISDRVQADVLMGEDGIARAIRFVRQQNSVLNYR